MGKYLLLFTILILVLTECKAYFKRKNFHKDSGPIAVYQAHCIERNVDDVVQSIIRQIQDFGKGQIVYSITTYNGKGCQKQNGFLTMEFYFNFKGENRLSDLVDKNHSVEVDFSVSKENNAIGRVFSNDEKSVEDYNKEINTKLADLETNEQIKCSKNLKANEQSVFISSEQECVQKYFIILSSLLANFEQINIDELRKLTASLKLKFQYDPKVKILYTHFCEDCLDSAFYKIWE